MAYLAGGEWPRAGSTSVPRLRGVASLTLARARNLGTLALPAPNGSCGQLGKSVQASCSQQ
jgi:hypothetical protein